MQPDVPPPPDGQAVAEPLVRELVRHQPLRPAPPVHVVGAEHRQALRLERDLEVVVGDDDRVRAANGYGPEQVLEERHHLAAAGRGRARPPPAAAAGTSSSCAGRSQQALVPPDLQRREVRRHRLGLLVHPADPPGPRRARDQPPVGDAPRSPASAVTTMEKARLVRRAVVAREPRRRAVGLAGDDDARPRAPPSRPRPTGRARAAAARRSAPRRRRLVPASTSRPSRTASRPSRCVHRSGRFPSTSTWLTRSPCRDEREPVERARRAARGPRRGASSRFVATR